MYVFSFIWFSWTGRMFCLSYHTNPYYQPGKCCLFERQRNVHSIGTSFTYAILSPTPADPLCRPFATAGLIVNPIPTVNTVSNMEICAGALATATFSGAVPGTVYNWTNSNTAIGLGASGTGNLSFT